MPKPSAKPGNATTKPEGHGSKVYSQYRAALGNLVAGTPTNERLREIAEEQGYVPVTQDNVAIEAGLDRKAISGAKARYPQLAAEIKSHRSTLGVKPTTTAKLGRLAESLAVAEQMIVVLQSRAADAIRKADAYRTELEDARAETARLRIAMSKLRK